MVLICLMLNGCCGTYFPPNRNLKRTVNETEIIGTWKLTPQSLALLQRDGFVTDPDHAYTITFNLDGSMMFASVVKDMQNGQYTQAAGQWTLEHDTNDNSNIHKTNALRFDIGRHLMLLNFTEQEGRLLLWNYYGDPDSWEFLEYERHE